MAASGALGPFLSTMLGLRAQRLQEEEIKAKMAAQQQEELMKGIQQAGQAFTSSMKQFGQDKATNKLVNELMPPSATAVDPAMQGKFTGRAGAPYTGGEAGWDKLMQVEKLRGDIASGRAADLWKQKNYDLARRNSDLRAAAETRAANKASYANQVMEKAPDAAKDIVKTSLAYQTKTDTLMEQMQKDMANDDQDSYLTHAREFQAYNDMHKGMKLGTALKDVPPFVGAKQAKLFADYAAAQSPQELTEAQQSIAESPLKSSPLAWGPKRAPANTPLDPGVLNRMSQGGQFTPQEAQQVSNIPQPAAPRPAPGAGPTIVKNKTTGQRGVWNYQTGKVDPLPTGQ